MQYLSSNPSNISFVFRFKYKANDTFNLLLLSDLHLDNPKTDRKAIKRLLEEAKEKQAVVLINGDLFCVMQGKGDKRANKSSIMQEHKSSDYFNKVVNDAYEFFKPYQDIIIFSGYGNHETSVIANNEVDVMQWLCDLMQKTGSPIVRGFYRGFINFVFEHESGGHIMQYSMYHLHGYGGGGASTKGVPQFQNLMQQIQGVNCIWMGHTHEYTHHINKIERLNQKNETIELEIDCLRTPSFKEEFINQGGGWHVEKGMGAKPIGGAWVELKSNEIKRKIYRAI
jgi:predicted phosphodiesterase